MFNSELKSELFNATFQSKTYRNWWLEEREAKQQSDKALAAAEKARDDWKHAHEVADQSASYWFGRACEWKDKHGAAEAATIDRWSGRPYSQLYKSACTVERGLRDRIAELEALVNRQAEAGAMKSAAIRLLESDLEAAQGRLDKIDANFTPLGLDAAKVYPTTLSFDAPTTNLVSDGKVYYCQKMRGTFEVAA